jgi:hypothetical protein
MSICVGTLSGSWIAGKKDDGSRLKCAMNLLRRVDIDSVAFHVELRPRATRPISGNCAMATCIDMKARTLQTKHDRNVKGI